MHCFAGEDKEQVLADVGLEMKDLFDNRDSTEYHYPGGAIVRRTYNKDFAQSGNKGDKSLFGSDRLPNDTTTTVYVVEGEKDVLTAQSEGLAAVSPRQGANTKPDRWDWSPLAGRHVVIVADRDENEAGLKHAHKVLSHIHAMVANVRLAEAAEGKDLTDHIMAGRTVDDLVEVEVPVVGRHLKLTYAAEVKLEQVRWIMQDWIPARSLTILAGREGIGKSTLAVDLAAKISRGTLDGELKGTPRRVLYLNSEDSRSMTIVPRLKAAGADLSMVAFADIQTEYTESGAISLPEDIQRLEQAVEQNNVGFIVLDAATSLMSSNINNYNDREVRKFLEPLAQLADRYDCAILGLAHFGKRDTSDTGKLLLGSIAWTQVARSMIAVAKDDESGHLVATATKSNLATQVRSEKLILAPAEVRTEDGSTYVGVVKWLGPTSVNAQDLLNRERPSQEQLSERQEIEQFIEGLLQDAGGSMPAKEALAAARAAGLNENAVKKARPAVATTSKVGGFNDAKWFWTLREPIAEAKLAAEDSTEDSRRFHIHERESSGAFAESESSPPLALAIEDTPASQPAGYTEMEQKVVDCLKHGPQREQHIIGVVAAEDREDIAQAIDDLAARRVIVLDGKKYFLVGTEQGAA